jgi:sugar phosphate isomerase/epimerase
MKTHLLLGSLTRRQLVAMSVAGAGHMLLGASDADARRQARKGSWGVQLYTVRDQIAKDPAAALQALARIGYTELEILQPTLPVVAPIAKQLGLSIVAAHLDMPTAKGEGLAAFIAQAKAHGVRYLVVPYVPPAERPTDRAGFEQLADRLARMSKEVSAAGCQLCYHNHAFEFGQDRDGTRWLDVIMQGTAASGMKLELDVFWAAITGADPVATIRQYSGRIALIHLKDKDPQAARSLVESGVPRQSFVEVGSGALDFKAILAAARGAAVEHYLVEQDFTPGDPVESLKKSYSYLAGLATR